MIKDNTCDICKKTPVMSTDIGYKGVVILVCKQCKVIYNGKCSFKKGDK